MLPFATDEFVRTSVAKLSPPSAWFCIAPNVVPFTVSVSVDAAPPFTTDMFRP